MRPKSVAGRKHNARRKALDKHFGAAHTESMLQLSGNNQTDASLATLGDLRKGDAGVLHRIDLPGDDARRLMEMGFLPGMRVVAGSAAPGGDPRIFQVDGSEIALRRETAKLLKIRLESGKTPRKM
jgi:ferrous iron transport protein A